MHQLILANLKLGHYSKAKAIGLERIWWLVVGGFWGLTLFFLGVLADILFFQVKSCFCWALERGFLLVKKSSNKETGVIFFVFSFLKGKGDVPKCEVKDFGIGTYPLQKLNSSHPEKNVSFWGLQLEAFPDQPHECEKTTK